MKRIGWWLLLIAVIVVDVAALVLDLFAPELRAVTFAVLTGFLLVFGLLRALEWRMRLAQERAAYAALARARRQWSAGIA